MRIPNGLEVRFGEDNYKFWVEKPKHLEDYECLSLCGSAFPGPFSWDNWVRIEKKVKKGKASYREKEVLRVTNDLCEHGGFKSKNWAYGLSEALIDLIFSEPEAREWVINAFVYGDWTMEDLTARAYRKKND